LRALILVTEEEFWIIDRNRFKRIEEQRGTSREALEQDNYATKRGGNRAKGSLRKIATNQEGMTRGFRRRFYAKEGTACRGLIEREEAEAVLRGLWKGEDLMTRRLRLIHRDRLTSLIRTALEKPRDSRANRIKGEEATGTRRK